MGWAADGVEREAFPAEIFEIHFVELEKIARQIFFVEPSVVVFSKKLGAHNLRWSLHADLPSRKNRLLGFPPPKFSKKATTDGRRKVFFVSRNFWLTKVFFQILAGKAVSGRCFNPLRPPKYPHPIVTPWPPNL